MSLGKAFVNMMLLDGSADMKPESGLAVLVRGEEIESIVPVSAVPMDFEIIDLQGKYLLPGLINLHVHLPSSGKPKKSEKDPAETVKLLRFAPVRAVVRKMCENNAKNALLSGTTTIRAVGGVMDFDTGLRDRINKGKCVGPRILAADCAVSVPGGHMTGSVAKAVGSAEEAASMVRDLSKHRPDLIKLMITGGVLDAKKIGEPGDLKMPAEYVKAAADEAHRLGYKVAAHVEGTEGMIVALENGVDTVEHGGMPTEETTRLFKKTGATLTATLSPAAPFCVLDKPFGNMTEEALINGKALFGNMVEGIKQALENGITVGLGTDAGCPYTTHYDMWRELNNFVKYCGVTPEFALHTATEINARIAGIDNITGTIEPEKSADFFVVDRNPLRDLTALRKPSMVVFRGKIIKNPKPKKYPEVEAMMDQLL